MTDADLVDKKLAFIETQLAALRRHVHPAEIEANPVVLGFASYALQTAIQAALDVASHIVSSERLGEPETNRQLFEHLVARGEVWWADGEPVGFGPAIGAPC